MKLCLTVLTGLVAGLMIFFLFRVRPTDIRAESKLLTFAVAVTPGPDGNIPRRALRNLNLFAGHISEKGVPIRFRIYDDEKALLSDFERRKVDVTIISSLSFHGYKTKSAQVLLSTSFKDVGIVAVPTSSAIKTLKELKSLPAPSFIVVADASSTMLDFFGEQGKAVFRRHGWATAKIVGTQIASPHVEYYPTGAKTFRTGRGLSANAVLYWRSVIEGTVLEKEFTLSFKRNHPKLNVLAALTPLPKGYFIISRSLPSDIKKALQTAVLSYPRPFPWPSVSVTKSQQVISWDLKPNVTWKMSKGKIKMIIKPIDPNRKPG